MAVCIRETCPPAASPRGPCRLVEGPLASVCGAAVSRAGLRPTLTLPHPSPPPGHGHHHRLRGQGAPDVGREDHCLLLLRLRHLLLRAAGGRCWGRGRRLLFPVASGPPGVCGTCVACVTGEWFVCALCALTRWACMYAVRVHGGAERGTVQARACASPAPGFWACAHSVGCTRVCTPVDGGSLPGPLVPPALPAVPGATGSSSGAPTSQGRDLLPRAGGAHT